MTAWTHPYLYSHLPFDGFRLFMQAALVAVAALLVAAGTIVA